METFHIQFTWPISVIKTMLEQVNVKGLGEINPKTEMYSSWPNKEDWQAWTYSIASKMITRTTEKTTQTIDDNLIAVETKLNNLLSSDVSKDDQVETLKMLISELEQIQDLIFTPNSCEHYPYFVRWFTLNLMVLTVFNQYETRVAQVKIVQLWYKSSSYLGRVMQMAVADRKNLIGQAFTGDNLDNVFIKDHLEQKALTKNINFDTKDEVLGTLIEIQEVLSIKTGEQHLQDIKFDETVSLLRIGREALAVTTESRTKQENLPDPTEFLTNFREMEQKQGEEAKEKVIITFNELVYSEPQALPSNPESRLISTRKEDDKKVDGIALTAAIIKEAAGFINNPSSINAVSVSKAIFSTAVGAIPGVGAIASAVTNLLFGLLFPPKPEKDLWAAFEEKMDRLIDEKLGEADAKSIENTLSAIEFTLRKYTTTLSKPIPFPTIVNGVVTSITQKKFITNDEIIELKGLLRIALNSLVGLHFTFKNPPSGSYFLTVRHYLRFFGTFMLALSSAKTLGMNIDEEKKLLYDGVLDYLTSAMIGIVTVRARDLIVDSNSDKSTKYFIQDRRLNKQVSELYSINMDTFPGQTILTHARDAARAIAVVRLLKELTISIAESIEKDSPDTANDLRKRYQDYSYSLRTLHWQAKISYSIVFHNELTPVADASFVSYSSREEFCNLDSNRPLRNTVFDK